MDSGNLESREEGVVIRLAVARVDALVGYLGQVGLV
jgi:hypothetical protein